MLASPPPVPDDAQTSRSGAYGFMTMHYRSWKRAIAATSLAAPLTLAACNNDPESGGLTVNYDFAPNVSCDQNQESVSEIRVEIGEEGMTATQTADCDNAGGELVLTGVPAGSYDMFVLGIDADGDAALDNLGGEITDDRVEVIGGDSKSVNVTLGLAPARLEVRFQVQVNDFATPCGSDNIQIKGLRAQAWDFNSSDQLLSHDFDLCDFDQFLPVPDDEREINGRRFDAVVLQPLDASGAPFGTDIELDLGGPVGAGKLVQIDASCDEGEGTCNATVLGGDPGPTTDTETPTGGDPSTGGDPTTGTDPSTGGADSTGGTTG